MGLWLVRLAPIHYTMCMRFVGLINPRRACARVTVVGLCVCVCVCVCVCLSVTTFSPTSCIKMAKKICTASLLHKLDFKTGDFRKSTVFKSYGVKKPTS